MADTTAPIIDEVTGVSIDKVGIDYVLSIPIADDGIISGTNGFQLSGGSHGVLALSDQDITANVITYKLNRVVFNDETTIRLAYVPGDFADDSANDLAAFALVPVNNNSTQAPDVTRPVEATAVFASGVFTLTFTETGTPPIIPTAGIKGFTFSANGVALDVADGVTTDATTATFALSSGAVYATDSLTYGYDTSAGNLTDSAYPPNELSGTSGAVVVNNSAGIDPRTSDRQFSIITASVVEDSVDIGVKVAGLEKGYVAFLSVPAAGGTTPTMDVVINGSDDDVTWTPFITFDQLTKSGSQMIYSAGKTESIPRYLQNDITIGGTLPEFAYSLFVAPKN